jgi:4-hydroxy-tetrahydrodipicolinate synthase
MVNDQWLEILSAVPSLFQSDGSPDRTAQRALFDRLEPLVDGLFVGGTTGEFPALTDAERLDQFTEALTVVGPARLVAHVGAASARQAAGLTRNAVAEGVTRVAAITPYYLPATIVGTLRYYERIVEAAGGAAVYGYLFPDVAGTDIPPMAVRRLADVGLRGIKVSGGASGRVAEYVAAAPTGFLVWSGNDADLPRLARCGARGVVSGVSAVAPQPFVRLRDALRHGRQEIAEASQAEVVRLVSLLGPSVARLKAGLAALGQGHPHCRMAIDEADSAIKAEIVGVVTAERAAMPA